MNRKTILASILALAMLLPIIPLGIVHAQTCVSSATGTGDVCFDFSSGTPAAGTPIGIGEPPYVVVESRHWPHGLFNIIVGRIAGTSIVITMAFPTAIPLGTTWTSLDVATGTWINDRPGFDSNNSDNVVTITVEDNGPEDLDPRVGDIQHFGGPTLPLSAPQDLDQSSGESTAQTLRAPNLHANFISINPSQTVANQPVTITTNVVNEGSMEGSTRLALKINGQVEQTQLVNVGPGGSRPVKFTVTKAEPGTYTVIIGNQRASFLITEDTAGKNNVDGGVIAILLLVLLAATVVIVLALSFRRKPSY